MFAIKRNVQYRSIMIATQCYYLTVNALLSLVAYVNCKNREKYTILFNSRWHLKSLVTVYQKMNIK